MKKYKKFKLKNGVDVLLVPRKASPTTTVMTIAKVGSKYEERDISGISHFIEHMAFKGTKSRPRLMDITKELDNIGASYNAFTSQEFTSFYAKARNGAFGDILNIISDIYLNPTYPEEELEKEKGVVIEEINMYEDTPQKKVQWLFLELLYGDQPAGWPVAGRKKVIKNLDREKLLDYKKKHYVGENTLVVISGGFSNEKMEDKLKDRFKKLGAGEEEKVPKVKEEQDKPSELIEYKDSDQTHMVLGVRAFDIFDKRRFALNVLTDILGGSMSSRLFQKVRANLGAAYYVGASTSLLSNNGYVSARAGADNSKVKTVLKAMLGEFKRLKNKKVSKEELERAKNHLIGKLMTGIETSDDLAFFYGSQSAINLDIRTPEDIAEEIKKITQKDIQGVAKDLFVNKSLNLSLIGPFKEASFGDILQID